MSHKFFLYGLAWAFLFGLSQPAYTSTSTPNPYKGREAAFNKWLKENPDPVIHRAVCSVLGAAIGDALGSYLEGQKYTATDEALNSAMRMPGGGPWEVAPGQVTDDTELAIALGQGLINMSQQNKAGEFKSHFILQEYVKWIQSKPFDKGNCTLATLGYPYPKTVEKVKERAKNFDTNAKIAYPENGGNKANGSMMRCTPLVIYGHKLTDDALFALMSEDSSLTHANEVVYYANATYAIAIKTLLNSKGGSDRNTEMKNAFNLAKAWLVKKASTDKHAQEVLTWITNAEQEGSPQKKGQDSKLHSAIITVGLIRIAFERAFYHLFQGSTFIKAMKDVIREVGDTDTNACIVGGMIGASYKSYEDLRNEIDQPEFKKQQKNNENDDLRNFFEKVLESNHEEGSQQGRDNYHGSKLIEIIPELVKRAPNSVTISHTKEKQNANTKPKEVIIIGGLLFVVISYIVYSLRDRGDFNENKKARTKGRKKRKKKTKEKAKEKNERKRKKRQRLASQGGGKLSLSKPG